MMNNKIRTKKSANSIDYYYDVTDIIRNIIPADITKAELLIDTIHSFTKPAKVDIAHLKSLTAEFEAKNSPTDTNLRLDSDELFITFSNGTTIKIWNSEWGGIRVCTKEDKNETF